MGKRILYLWVENHLSMPNINIVFHLSFSVHFLLPHLSNCGDRNNNKPVLFGSIRAFSYKSPKNHIYCHTKLNVLQDVSGKSSGRYLLFGLSS